LEACRKCKAKREGKKWTGPHDRIDTDCLLGNDPRWTRNASSSSTSSSSSSGPNLATTTATTTGAAAGTDDLQREKDPGDKVLPRMRKHHKHGEQTYANKFASVWPLSPEGEEWRAYLGRTSTHHNDAGLQHLRDGTKKWTPVYGAIQPGETSRGAARRLLLGFSMEISEERLLFVEEGPLTYGHSQNEEANLMDVVNVSFTFRAESEEFGSSTRGTSGHWEDLDWHIKTQVNFHSSHSYPLLEERWRAALLQDLIEAPPGARDRNESRRRRQALSDRFSATGIRISILRDLEAGGERCFRGLLKLHKDW
jgi:hypothetical protein